MVEAVLAYTIKAIDEASSVMDKIKGSIGLLGSSLSSLGGGFADVGNVMTGFATGGPAGAIITAAGEIVKGLQTCIEDASKTETVFTSLGAAVTRSGIAWDTVSEATKSALIAIEATTVYSKDMLAPALERLITFGLSYDEAMKALGASVDFAAAKHMDLTTAATLVGKAMDGNTAILKRYGVDLETTKDQAGELKLAHDAAAGAIKALGKSVDDWVVSVTAAIGADTTFQNGLDAAKDKAQYLIEQFKAGNIDLPQFTTAMQSLGVQLDAAKMSGGSAAEVLTKLNEQFGGAAQAAAGTYAGIQERLKNATAEVGEKIGNIMLPALASLTEAMIPVVDWFGKDVDAASAWITEMSKSADLEPILTALHDAFVGLGGYLLDLQKFMMDNFGPALKDIVSAFKDLYDALSPIGDALKELAGAFGDTGDIDLFKTLIMAVVIQIRAIAEIIKDVAPYIREFATMFKDAADFISPILKQIVDAVRTFTTDLRTIFQEFYNWLIGKSLWIELWDAVTSVTVSKITEIMAKLTTGFFSPLKTEFDGAVKTMQDLWAGGWNTIQGTLQSATTIMQGIWQGFSGFMTGAIAAFEASVSGASSFLSGILAGMIAAAQTAFSTVQGILSGISAANAAATTAAASTHDIIGTSNIISQIGPTVPTCPAGSYWNGSACVPYLSSGPPPSPTTLSGISASVSTAPPSPTTLNATIPVTVKVDSQTVAKQVTTTIVNSVQDRRAGGRL
jgi:hypothetical protein